MSPERSSGVSGVPGSAAPAPSPGEAGLEQVWRELCREALSELEVTLRLPPPAVGEEVDRVERLLARARDALIRLARRDVGADGYRRTLERVNAVLSLVVGIEYPAAGIQWTSIEAARKALAELLEIEPPRQDAES